MRVVSKQQKPFFTFVRASHSMRNRYMLGLLLMILTLLGGCSLESEDVRHASSRPNVNSSRSTSVLVKPRTIVTKPRQNRRQIIKAPIRVAKPYQPQVRKYRIPKPVVPVLTKEEQAIIKQQRIKIEKSKREVLEDPYASIPDSDSVNKTSSNKPIATKQKGSSAVSALMVQARAEMLVGSHSSAESKLERGLRIEPENPKLWFLLAKAHYGQENYSQSVSMAKKSIRYSNDEDLIAQNWSLIKKSGNKSGDMTVVKEALDYDKSH